METIVSTTDSALIGNLQYELPKNAQYVEARRYASFPPSSGNVYSASSGARVIRFTLTGSDWLDPHSLYLQYKIGK